MNPFARFRTIFSFDYDELSDVSPSAKPSAYDEDGWEDEQKRLDREWYGNDEGYDDTNNPFADVSDEYAMKKEKEFEVFDCYTRTRYLDNLEAPWYMLPYTIAPETMLTMLTYCRSLQER